MSKALFITIGSVIVIGIMLITTSCSPGKGAVTHNFLESIHYLNSNKIDEAIKSARDLGQYSDGASTFLLSQYGVYLGEMRGGAFDKNNANYKKMSQMDLNDQGVYEDSRKPSAYRGEYLAAKAFTNFHLLGAESTRALLKAECWNWRGESPGVCMNSLMTELESVYLLTKNRYYAIALFEVSDVSGGSGLRLVDQKTSDFFKAIALFYTDHKTSTSILTHLNKDNVLNSYMTGVYCKIASDGDLQETGIICSGYRMGI